MTEWIKCSERLPEDVTKVLIAVLNPWGYTVEASWWCGGGDPPYWSVGDDMIDVEHVTHWMPLPEPPK